MASNIKCFICSSHFASEILLGDHFLRTHDVARLETAMIPKVQYDDYDKLNKAVTHIFVYGTLRPDSKSSWAKRFCEAKGVSYKKGTIDHAKLFLDKRINFMVAICSQDNHKKDDVVHGYLITSTSFKKLVEDADDIECYPKLYDRVIVDAKDGNGDIVKAFLYTRKYDTEMSHIPGGDYLKS